MSNWDPVQRAKAANAGGKWIIGIIAIVVVGLLWWVGATAPERKTAGAGFPAPASTSGSAPVPAYPARTPVGTK